MTARAFGVAPVPRLPVNGIKLRPRRARDDTSTIIVISPTLPEHDVSTFSRSEIQACLPAFPHTIVSTRSILVKYDERFFFFILLLASCRRVAFFSFLIVRVLLRICGPHESGEFYF